ncbi:MAG: NUDIX domain-containing protein [Clostridia bacterium]|nr:NUDIX domain-containing protein [Clostridia bacterium]
MNYCMECGTKLKRKPLKGEGEIPYCEHCKSFLFPVFSTACSMIVLNPEKTKILLIPQYGREEYILVAGYVNKGEDAETAALREIREELGVEAAEIRFNRTHYFGPSNTLMINFRILLDSEEIHPNEEIDSWQWFSLEEARERVRPNSLARDFLEGMLDGAYHFHDDKYGISR